MPKRSAPRSPLPPARPAALAAWAACVACFACLAWACGAGNEATPLGYVVAPSVPVDLAAAPPPFAPFDAGPAAYRALPPEPVALGCTREVVCQREEDEVPSLAYPPPFERCSDRYVRAAVVATFSGTETRRVRQVDATACCYVSLRDCGRGR